MPLGASSVESLKSITHVRFGDLHSDDYVTASQIMRYSNSDTVAVSIGLSERLFIMMIERSTWSEAKIAVDSFRDNVCTSVFAMKGIRFLLSILYLGHRALYVFAEKDMPYSYLSSPTIL